MATDQRGGLRQNAVDRSDDGEDGVLRHSADATSTRLIELSTPGPIARMASAPSSSAYRLTIAEASRNAVTDRR